ncbi:hypothetical protein C8Q74DRAFT_175067 [Fomes fomentarius]|nr:hypothetical protein C8Q74DRAFT_175067 [Fomes fomentarius]
MSRSSTVARTRAVLFALGFACTQCVTQVSGKFVDPMQQGFLFDWSGDQSPPNPTAAQCQVLHITWGRRSANGPNPAAPYFLQIYTSTFITPFVIPAGSGQSFDWPVPFVPGTQFQICMFASNNVTGGCQQVSTVYQAPNTTLADPPTCQNLTYYQPDQVLGVDATLPDGSWSTYGWVNQCSDISIKPTNGTPPYTYTISPALRPPYNFTSDNKDPVDWTVTLAYGLPFWLTVADSSGMAWTQGPLHASGGSTACLSAGSSSSDSDGLSTGATVGVAFGGLIVGLLAGAIGAIFFLRRRSVRYQQVNSLHLRHKSAESPSTSDWALQTLRRAHRARSPKSQLTARYRSLCPPRRR